MNTRRGFFHEDAERIVQVVALKKGQFGVGLKYKGANGQLVRFAISTRGARLLLKFLREVMDGKGTRIKDGLVSQETQTAMRWTNVPQSETK